MFHPSVRRGQLADFMIGQKGQGGDAFQPPLDPQRG
jgi:hypothetical protein